MSSDMPLVSVIIPTYNRADRIHKSIDSVVNQTYENLEIIIVDDASTDDTKSVIEGYIEADNRIKYVYNNSAVHGPSAARNCGINAATGEYICFNDSDDAFRETKVYDHIEIMRASGADISFSVKKKGAHLSPWSYFKQEDISIELILHSCFTGAPALFGKARCFKETLFDENMNCNEDWELVIRLVRKYKLAFLNKILLDVDDTPDSVGSSAERGTKMMYYMLEKHADLYDKYPKSRKKMMNQIRYSEAVTEDNLKHTIGTRIKRYATLIKVMK